MKTLVKNFVKKVRPYAAVVVAATIVTVFPSWTAGGKKDKDGEKAAKAKTEVTVEVMKVPVAGTAQAMDVQADVTFTYNAPSGSFPYADAKVKNLANWTTGDACNDQVAQQVACSITVPFANTMAGGTQIDPTKVSIQTFLHGPAINQNYGVDVSPSLQYVDPINRPAP